MTLDELRQVAPTLGPTLTPEQYVELTGTGRTKVYEQLRADEFPLPVIRHGRTYRIPTVPVLRLLGLEDP